VKLGVGLYKENGVGGINQGVVFDVCRLKAEFADEIGNVKSISGTGFWIKDNDNKVFVTNKHNVNPTLNFGAGTNYRLLSLDIELRVIDKSIPQPDTKFISVDIKNSILEDSLDADAAVILNPKYLDDVGPYRSAGVLSKRDLANTTFFSQNMAIMDTASFIGFAGNQTSQWWDQQWNLGVARTVNIASVPSIPFTHRDVRTSDITLVAGLSFSGSSGSVVISHEKGVRAGAGLSNSSYVPPKIIGIMSGHWPDGQGSVRVFVCEAGLRRSLI
jgi:hypothetical protein